jgi:hypothetical protein
MTAGEQNQVRLQQVRERPCDLVDRKDRVALTPKDKCWNTAGPQHLANVFGLARIEVTSSAYQVQTAVLTLVCSEWWSCLVDLA